MKKKSFPPKCSFNESEVEKQRPPTPSVAEDSEVTLALSLASYTAQSSPTHTDPLLLTHLPLTHIWPTLAHSLVHSLTLTSHPFLAWVLPLILAHSQLTLASHSQLTLSRPLNSNIEPSSELKQMAFFFNDTSLIFFSLSQWRISSPMAVRPIEKPRIYSSA